MLPVTAVRPHEAVESVGTARGCGDTLGHRSVCWLTQVHRSKVSHLSRSCEFYFPFLDIPYLWRTIAFIKKIDYLFLCFVLQLVKWSLVCCLKILECRKYECQETIPK